jgi:hypothetical protein
LCFFPFHFLIAPKGAINVEDSAYVCPRWASDHPADVRHGAMVLAAAEEDAARLQVCAG